MKIRFQHSILSLIILGGGIISCQNRNDPQPTIAPFTVTVKQRTAVADLRPSHFVNDLLLTWNKARISTGDSVTYAVFYKDTLIKNLADTSFTIQNVGDNATGAGVIVARTKQGITTSMPFNFTTGRAPRVRIKKWISQSVTFKYYNVVTYTYDSLGRLASFNSQEGKVCCFTNGQTTVLTYNPVGQLIRVEALPNGDNTGQFPTYLKIYEYDERGKPILIKYYSPPIYYQQTPLEYKADERPEYDAAGLLIRSTISSPTYQTVYDYTYSHGNLIRLRYSDRTDSVTYHYDDKPNPFYGLLNSTRQTQAYSIYSKNNAIVTGSTYTYDSNGLIVKSVSSDPKLQLNMYEYEGY